MFVLAVVASKLARDMILAPNVGPLQQTTAEIIVDTGIKINQQKSQKSLRQLEVVPNPPDGFPDDLDGYFESDLYKNHPAAFVSSRVPNRRTPAYINI